MRNQIRKALTRTLWVKDGRKPREIQITPSDRLIYGIYFAIVALISLTALEATHILVLRNFSTEIFAAITLVIGAILGAFFGQKA